MCGQKNQNFGVISARNHLWSCVLKFWNETIPFSTIFCV